jgi:spore germination protein
VRVLTGAMHRRTLVSLVAAVALTASVTTASAANRPRVDATGYAMAGSAEPSDITRDGGYLRTIGIDGVTLDGPSRVTPVSADAQRLRRAAQKHGRRAVLLVSNYTDALGDFDEKLAHRMLTSPSRRAAVVAALRTRAKGFDGVQIDLESLKARDTEGLVAFTRELRAAVPRLSLSMAFMASTDARGYRANGYDLTALAPSLDRMVLMAYDQHGPWSGSGPIGSLPWVRQQLAYFVRALPDDRIDLGVAAYGYQWGGGADTITVPQARKKAGTRARWSARHGEWTARLPGGRRIWWSDRRSLAAREKIARRTGIHGVAIWQIGSSGRLR